MGLYLGNCPGDILGVADIARDSYGLPVTLLCHVVECIWAPPQQDDGIALGGKAHCGRCANPTASSANHHNSLHDRSLLLFVFVLKEMTRRDFLPLPDHILRRR